jgi:SAM-dependent methyltransferase
VCAVTVSSITTYGGVHNVHVTDVPEAPAYPADAATVLRRDATSAESIRANRHWWDGAADAYQAEHGSFLGDVNFVWGPEGLNEADVRLLGDVSGRRVLEVGCGGGQCGRWLVAQGAYAIGLELSFRQLQHAADLDRRSGVVLPAVQGDAEHLPFTDAAFDIVTSSFGGYPFIADKVGALREAARVLRPGGTLVFSVPHPMRWCFYDDPTENGLVAHYSYFDRSAYVEEDESGGAVYVEHHHTIGDWIRSLAAAGFEVVDLVEPEWPDDNPGTWGGGWSALRGRVIPGTAIFVCRARS